MRHARTACACDERGPAAGRLHCKRLRAGRDSAGVSACQHLHILNIPGGRPMTTCHGGWMVAPVMVLQDEMSDVPKQAVPRVDGSACVAGSGTAWLTAGGRPVRLPPGVQPVWQTETLAEGADSRHLPGAPAAQVNPNLHCLSSSPRKTV